MRGYLPLIRKDSSAHMHSLAVYLKEELPFAWDLSLENSVDSYVFDWLYFTQCLFLYQSLSSLSMGFDSISPNIDQVLSINPSAKTLTSVIRIDLPILVELINLVNSVTSFLSQTTFSDG